MTDNEIIKALECCNNGWCDGRCPYYGREDIADCREQSGADQLDLINRQKAEIERLTDILNATINGQETLQRYVTTAKAEAIKEFSERLQKYGAYVTTDEIDETKKEMVGDVG